MSRFPLFDLARDATVAVGAYVGVLREHVKAEWATVLGGSFDERVAEATARMEAHADALADKEAEEEVSEPLRFGCAVCDHNAGWHRIGPGLDMPCHMPECGCTDYYPVIRHSDLVAQSSVPGVFPSSGSETSPAAASSTASSSSSGGPRCGVLDSQAAAGGPTSSTGSPRKGAVGEPPEVEPTPLAPSGGIACSIASAAGWACNCVYGSQDPRCCIQKARQQELEDAYARGAAAAVRNLRRK